LIAQSPPGIVLVVPRGEAVRNFLYSDTLPTLAASARVSVLSVVDDEALLAGVREHVEEIIPLRHYPPAPWVSRLRVLVENAHDRWLWSEVAKNNWELRDRRAAEQGKRLQRVLVKASARALAWRPALRALTSLEQRASLRTSDTGEFEALFNRIKPDLVFNCSHIHGIAGELPLKVAHRMGITTAGFIFSWDNLTSRSRIFVPYDHWFVWHDGMKRQILEIYPQILANNVHLTGTPQFDYHFKPEFDLGRAELCRRIGIDPSRPFVLYTAGIAHHFLEEHRHVELVIDLLREFNLPQLPQLVVRTNIKDTSPEMEALAARGLDGVVFPRPLWDEDSLTPREDDLALYSSLLRHCVLGVNAASTVSLELLMLDKPVINLDFDPPGSDLPWCRGYRRHILFDHYRPVAEGAAVMVARSSRDMAAMLRKGLMEPSTGSEERRNFIAQFFAGVRLGSAGGSIGCLLVQLTSDRKDS
jgi:hypothetical protein